MKHRQLLPLGLGLLTGLTATAQRTTTATTMTETTTQVVTTTTTQPAASAADYEKFRFGGYGEMVASFMNYGTNRFSGLSEGNTRERRNSIAIPRAVLALDYKFTPKWILGMEVEFEAGGVGVETELESSENGEYETEMEKGGEVALEQFHITRLLLPELNVRVGHLILPVGLTNSHHEPILFFGTTRPESETTFLPSTWHETGLEVFGTLGRGHAAFNYQAMVVAGLNADGFGRDAWVADGKQGLFETDNFSSPAYVGRVDYVGVKGLRTGVSMYYCGDTGRNADKKFKYAKVGKVPVRIFTADAQYLSKHWAVRANVIYGNLSHAAGVSSVTLSNKSGYHSGAMRKTAKEALAYGIEAGYNLHNFWPYLRYEYFNPQEGGDTGQTMDARCQVSKWSGGVNWRALPNLVVKADYSSRQIGTHQVFGRGKYRSESEFSLGVAYVGWFIKK
jgi:hypothetical protein